MKQGKAGVVPLFRKCDYWVIVDRESITIQQEIIDAAFENVVRVVK